MLRILQLWRQSIATTLIFVLLLSQTIRVDFFGQAEASQERYRDIVSIIVDKDTYSTTRAKIMRYAEDIQSYLGSTQVSLYVVDKDTPTHVIAAQNEKLYYEGTDSDRVDRLVGTILIGDIPVPMVSTDSDIFPSVYPYVDFVDKKFTYDDNAGNYVVADNANQKVIEPEIWHGLINPAVGREWNRVGDIDKVEDFLDKTHDFYTKQGVFTPSNIPPRVFYYDGFNESAASDARSLFQYTLNMKNSENIAYKRFTKYLLTDINTALKQYDSQYNREDTALLQSFGVSEGSDTLNPSTITNLPDIQTEAAINGLIKDFYSIINKKTLSDQLLAVRNAGRYSDSNTVRADIASTMMTTMDTVARGTLRDANNSIMDSIDNLLISQGYAKRIPIFDSFTRKALVGFSGSLTSTSSGAYGFNEFVYQNYFFGKRSNEITSPEQCTIARGSSAPTTNFGRSLLVEANTMYDTTLAEAHAAKLEADTTLLIGIHRSPSFSCFDTATSRPKALSYWGDNSVLSLATSASTSPTDIFGAPPGGTSFTAMTESVFSLNGMKESSRIGTATLSDCTSNRYQYALENPGTIKYLHTKDVGETSETIICTKSNLSEWNINSPSFLGCPESISPSAPNPVRYSCLSDPDSYLQTRTFAEDVSRFKDLACLYGDLQVDGANIFSPKRSCIDTIGSGEDVSTVDNTIYESVRYHTIPSILRHISPTDTEISAAKTSAITPSLPVDMVRYVEFLTPKGNIARLNYPNFFEAQGDDIASFRAWLTTQSQTDWNNIIAREATINLNPTEAQANIYLGAGVLPSSPVDWNRFISDEVILKIIQSRNWLNPDVSNKYVSSVEDILSYSQASSTTRTDGSPRVPRQNNSYEVAYLGLAPFSPTLSGSSDDSGQDAEYQGFRSQLRAINLTEDTSKYDSPDAAPSDNCGPPDGVNLFQWPSAIVCWIKSLTPIRIVGMACGANTLGIKTSITASTRLPTSDNINSFDTLSSFYTGGKLVYNLSRQSIVPGESTDIELHYVKDNTILGFPANTRITLEPLSVKDKNKSLVASGNLNEYVTITPNPTIITEEGAKFLISTRSNQGDVFLRASIVVNSSDNKTITLRSDDILLRITDEYINVVPRVDGKITSTIPVTTSSGMTFDFSINNKIGTKSEVQFPLKLSIFDEVGEVYIASGVVVDSEKYIFPSLYTRQIGVYRLEFQDQLGRIGTHSISVAPGVLTRVTINPVSSSLLRGSNVPVTIRLRDALGNLITPDLHSVEVTLDSGYILTQDGQRKTTMRLDSLDPEVTLTIGTDESKKIGITAIVDGELRTSSDIDVFESANIVLSREGISHVGGAPQKVTLRVQSPSGQVISGFHSLAHLSLPDGAGIFSPSVVTIRDGISEVLDYIPGQVAGEHPVTVSIPGLGVVPDILYSVSAGDPLYVTHTESSGSIVFSLRDRYDNISRSKVVGTMRVNNDTAIPIEFVDGLYKYPKISGIISIDVPGIAANNVSYSDVSGTYLLTGSQFYTAYSASPVRGFDFHDDYNARYTVLAGGSFLREAEDILYNTKSGSGQSLAVTTLLDTPYNRDNVLSIVPGGRYIQSDNSDIALEPTLTLDDGYPHITFRDSISKSIVADATYRALKPELVACTNVCPISTVQSSYIELIQIDPTMRVSKLGSSIALMENDQALVTVYNNGKIQYRPGITLILDGEQDGAGILIVIEYGGKKIGQIYYQTNQKVSIGQGGIDVLDDTVTLKTYSNYSTELISLSHLNSPIQGLMVIGSRDSTVFDNFKNGPETIDSLGIISELPNVGWQGSNRMLLSYAGGDTVGQSTRWFHTYTMINLGDPVAHNDRDVPGTEYDGIDRSLGTQLTSSNTTPVHSYVHGDMNNDGYDDILVLYTNGYVELLLNLVDRFRSKGNIAYIPDIISRGFSLADFTSDGYGDILGVDEDGDLVLIDNSDRRFSRMSVTVQPGASIPTHVNQFKVQDMDGDTLDDIVYITDGGELGILYGTTTSGLYQKSILDSTLGITLSSSPIITGGAIYASHIPQLELSSSTTSTGIDESILNREIYYPFSLPDVQESPEPIDTTTLSGRISLESELSQLRALQESYQISPIDSSQPITSIASQSQNFVRSEYAEIHGLLVNKRYNHLTNPVLRSGDRVRTTIEIKNTSTKTISDIEYLDSIPKIFDADKTIDYIITQGSGSTTREFTELSYSDFSAYFTLPDIRAGEVVTLTYDLAVLPASYGELLLGDYERGEIGHDVYGDVAFKTDTTCGADMMVWRSDSDRGYTRGTRTFADANLPTNITTSLTDVDNNGVPDSIDNITLAEQKNLLNSVNTSSNITSPDLVKINLDPNRQMLDIGFDDATVANIQNQVQDIMDGLACGFGGGSCMAFPINWAPLAPGSAPVAFGYPLSDLVPSTGKPVLSGLTCQLITFTCGTAPCTLGIPSIFPASTMGANTYGMVGGANNGAACGNTSYANGAGGSLGINSQMNNFRIYVTPTLTLGAGAAFCFGQPRLAGNTPPQGTWPLAQGGNCIVVAKPMSMCKDDGSIADGDVRGISGLGTTTDAWNAGSCNIKADTGGIIEDENLRRDIVAYTRAPDKSKLNGLYTRMGSRTSSTVTGGPLLRMGGASSGGALTGIDITLDSTKPLDVGNVVKLNNKRVAGFPDFIMDWVARQTDQITNALLTPPNLVIIRPTSVGQNSQFDGSIDGLTDRFKDAYNENALNSIRNKSGEAYSNVANSQSASNVLVSSTKSSKNNATSDLGKWINEQQNNFDTLQDSAFKLQVGKIANEGKGGLSAMRAAYKLVGKLPLISISEKTIPVDVPWILPQELDRYARAMDAYSKELNTTIENFCANDPSPECLLEKGRLESSGLRSTVNQNLKIIEEYKNFPIKLQKYVTWKQRYLSQVLCYITEVQQMTTGWVKDNSIRFQKWAELIVLIRAIADSWQPLLDIVAQKNAQCAVCRNERYNAKYFKYKIISALIPSIPVIQFPRWPDIVLDLSDVRLGIVLVMPNFQFNLKPIRLPDLPRFSLPRVPGVGLTLPKLDLLPPIPSLPDLPDLPAIPTIKLPNLPPPPKLPKIFASLGVGLKILKLFKLMECYVNKTTLVPEWTVGDVIAQRTERQGTIPMDFLDVSLPQFSIPSIREIRVSSHVNFDMRSEFIAEFAEAAVGPINSFGADLGRGIPKKIGEDIKIQSPGNININLQSRVESTPQEIIMNSIALIEKDRDIFLSVDDFKREMVMQFASIPEFAPIVRTIDEKLARAEKDAKIEEDLLIAYNKKKFDIIHRYIEEQYKETAEMQNIIDLLQTEDKNLLSMDSTHRSLLVSDPTNSRSASIAREWNEQSMDIGERIIPDTTLEDTRDNLSKRLSRIAAATTTSSTTSSTAASPSIPSGYAPSYNGIYIITEGGNQTRLFDYTELLRGDDTATRVDIDRDGDMDYLFILDGTLFLKNTNLRIPNKIVDRTITTKDIDKSIIPTAPDFFHEDTSSSSTFAFSYNTTRDTDTQWRVEFYDKYMEWDMVKQGIDEAHNTPKHIIDVISQDTQSNNTPTVRTLLRVGDPDGFVMEGPRIQILTGSLDFTLSPGRTLYAGGTNTTIIYSTGSSVPYLRKTLGPAEQIRFSETTNVSLESGKAFIIYPSVIGESYVYNQDMIGMPIIPGMRIATGDAGVTLRDHTDNSDMTLAPRSTYRYEDTYSDTEEYSIRVPYSNGFYFPKITNLYGTRVTAAGEILFAPRASSDTSAPLISIDSITRIPLYQKKEILLKDIITETNDYTVMVDSDITQDGDGNGVYDDDFSFAYSTGATVDDNSLRIGPFDTLGTINMMLRVEDEFHNISITEFPIEVYSPVPTIIGATKLGDIRGVLDESLSREPIDVFRVRTGMDIYRLNQDSSFYTSETGIFSGQVNSNTSGSVLTHSGKSINISERGTYSNLPNEYRSEVVLANNIDPMHLIIRDSRGASLYKQFFVVPNRAPIIKMNEYSPTGTGLGIFVQQDGGYDMVSAGISDPSIPGGVYIVDSSYVPIVAIARDGNVYPMISNVVATFTQKDGYPQISIDTPTNSVADILYKFDFFYTLK